MRAVQPVAIPQALPACTPSAEPDISFATDNWLTLRTEKKLWLSMAVSAPDAFTYGENFVRHLRSRGIDTVEVDGCMFFDQPLAEKFWLGLQRARHLKSVRIDVRLNNELVVNNALNSVPAAPQLGHIRELTLLVNAHDQTLDQQGGLEKVSCSNISELAWRNGKLDDHALEYIAQMPALRKLNIEGNSRVTRQGIKELGNVRRKVGNEETGLEALALSDVIRDEEFKEIEGLDHLKSLELGFSHCTRENMQAIAHLPKLDQLAVRDSDFESGIGAILAQSPRLKRLKIERCNLSRLDLASLTDSPTIEEIDVCERVAADAPYAPFHWDRPSSILTARPISKKDSPQKPLTPIRTSQRMSRLRFAQTAADS